MKKIIKIGTRESKLALWQAELVSNGLRDAGMETEIVAIHSEGDLQLNKPLYELGITGIFTRTLDAALLAGKIDIAVHSYKDVPTKLAEGIAVVAVLKRGNPFDLLISNKNRHINVDANVIATSSLRRMGQWRHRYPGTEMTGLRGNIQTRLSKLHSSNWTGAVFAAAAIERLELNELETGKQELLHWMLPAPAQGAIVVVANEKDKYAKEACALLHHEDTAICIDVERYYLRALQGGCSTPAGAYAKIIDSKIHFKGNLVGADGSDYREVALVDEKHNADKIVQQAAGAILSSKNLLLT